jgi:hypothetical protein
MRIIQPRLLLFLVIASSTTLWCFYKPLFTYEKYVSLNGIFHYLLFFVLIFLSCFMIEKTSFDKSVNGAGLEKLRKTYGEGDGLRKEALILGIIALAAQMLWIARIIKVVGFSPLIQLVFVEQNILKFKEQVVNVTGISGVTTLTQLGLIASAIYSIHIFGLKNKGSLWMWTLILFPGILRGLFFSERIALLEVILPIIIIAVLFKRIKVTLLKMISAVATVIVFFSAAEGLRSYQFYSKNGFEQDGVYSYGLGRFLDYISSSVNHSMAMVDLSGRTFGFPALLFNGWINFLYNVIPESKIRSFLHMNETLQAYINVKSSPYSAADYTNMGFFGEVFADVGYLYFFYALLFGIFIGLAYKGTLRYEVGWMAIYPTVCFSLLESYRGPYLFDNRVFYPLLYLLARYLFLLVQQSKGEENLCQKNGSTGWILRKD